MATMLSLARRKHPPSLVGCTRIAAVFPQRKCFGWLWQGRTQGKAYERRGASNSGCRGYCRFSSRVTQTREAVGIQTFVAHRAVEAFHVGILHRLAGLNELQSQAPFFAPRGPRPPPT